MQKKTHNLNNLDTARHNLCGVHAANAIQNLNGDEVCQMAASIFARHSYLDGCSAATAVERGRALGVKLMSSLCEESNVN